MRAACSAFRRKKRSPEKRDHASQRRASAGERLARAAGSGSARPVARRKSRASRRPKALERALRPRGIRAIGSSLPV